MVWGEKRDDSSYFYRRVWSKSPSAQKGFSKRKEPTTIQKLTTYTHRLLLFFAFTYRSLLFFLLVCSIVKTSPILKLNKEN